MKYVVYCKATTAIVGKPYASIGAAKSAITRMSKKWVDRIITDRREPEVDFSKSPIFLYAVAELSHYRQNIEKKVERVNLMSGKKYLESVNTPLSCSPASETYWSM